MQCPKDETTLQSEVLGSCLTHRCAKCLGIFLPGTLFKEIKAAAVLEFHKQELNFRPELSSPISSRINCPNDANAMKTLTFKGIEIEVCPSCFSLWLDQGELEKIALKISISKEINLSKIGTSLGTIGGHTIDLTDIDSIGDIFDLFSSIADMVGSLSDFNL
jgi:Zn-finger nucleic acid-binding protein